MFTNKAPGGVAYSCSFRITEAVYLVERLTDMLARELGMDPAELRMRNLLRPEQFPYTTPTGWQYDSGDYPRALQLALDMAGYDELRREQAERRARGEYMGIGLSFFTEGVGAGPRSQMDILGLGMADGADLRVHPTGKAVLAISVQTQGQGHETTFAQLVAHELGLSPDDVEVVHGDTDRTPFGLGTYGSRSTPVSGRRGRRRRYARCASGPGWWPRPCSRSPRTTWSGWTASGGCAATPTWASASREIARAAHSSLELPAGVEGHLDASAVYNPPNLTFPFGAYICVTDVDPGTGEVQGPPLHRSRRLRRPDQPDDRRGAGAPRPGGRHRHRADAVHRRSTRSGNCLSGSFMDYLLPTSLECPSPELGETVTPSPHHPVGAKGIGESATVGSPAAVVNSVVDALAPFGVVHADMPLTPGNVWRAIQGRPVRTDLSLS